MFINDFFNTNVTESKQVVSDYDTWSDQVAAQGGEVHPQRDRVRLVAQSWDGDTIGEFNLRTGQGWINDQQGVAEGAEDLYRQALDVADKLTTDKNLAKLNDMAHDSTIYRALERYFAKNNISTTIFNRVAAIVFKKLDKYGRRLSTDPRIQEQGVAETTGDPKFDKMLKGITGKRQVAKQQKADTKQQARDAFGGMFGGGNPADSLGIRKKSVDEGSELPPNVIDMIKKIAQSSAAPEHKKAMINALIAKYSNSSVAETYGVELHTKHKRNRFKQLDKIKQQQEKAFGLSEAGCTMTEEGRTCPVHGMNECPGYEMTETSPQDKLHQRHQEIRKKSGLPHPDHYLKMMKQKQAEIDALKADIAADRAKGLGEARKPDYNFDIEDIKKLERIRDLPTLKTLAFELISKPSAKPMKPEKVEWFRSALERMDSPLKVIKLMYDLMLSGEGHQVIGSRNSMKANSYRGRFSEQEDISEDVERYVEALSRAGYELQEEKVRLDPKCWKGKKIGNPKTKMKGGVRVNNCVPK